MVTTFVETIVDVITGILTGIGGAISTFFENVFMTGTGETATVSMLGIFILALVGLSLAVGLSRWVLGLIRRR